VQVIKKDPRHGGVLEFGTEIVSEADGSLAALLGASPGASTAASIMVKLLHKCFPDQYKSESWQAKLTEIIPSFGQSLAASEALCVSQRAQTAEILGLTVPQASHQEG
jgi:malate dehydrogenase (quinone)